MFTVKFMRPYNGDRHIVSAERVHVSKRDLSHLQAINVLDDGYEVTLYVGEDVVAGVYPVTNNEYHWPMAVIENAQGKTTEIVRAPDVYPKANPVQETPL